MYMDRNHGHDSYAPILQYFDDYELDSDDAGLAGDSGRSQGDAKDFCSRATLFVELLVHRMNFIIVHIRATIPFQVSPADDSFSLVPQASLPKRSPHATPW